MTAGKEELKRFEGCAEERGGGKDTEGETPPAVASRELLVAGRSRSSSIQATVGSWQRQETGGRRPDVGGLVFQFFGRPAV